MKLFKFLGAFALLVVSIIFATANSISAQTAVSVGQPTAMAVNSKIESSPVLKVGPGQTGSNCDVTVKNTSGSGGGSATIDPKDANPNCDSTNSTVTTKSNFDGDVTGIEDGDTVNIGANNGSVADPVDVSGTGGTVNIGNNLGSNVSVHCTATSGTGINVTVNGATVNIPPGSTGNFNN
jgi:hypothetical protein